MLHGRLAMETEGKFFEYNRYDAGYSFGNVISEQDSMVVSRREPGSSLRLIVFVNCVVDIKETDAYSQ
jgi:hypothetical protein